jgi:drug/metabolite transporter superfamily protein YnfA
MSDIPTNDAPKTAFEDAARKKPRGGLLAEFWQFLKHNKKWWLLPIVLTLLVLALLLWLSSTAAAPFIYTLF